MHLPPTPSLLLITRGKGAQENDPIVGSLMGAPRRTHTSVIFHDQTSDTPKWWAPAYGLGPFQKARADNKAK